MSELTQVLLVDDNSKYLKDALPFYGYEVTVAVSYTHLTLPTTSRV